MTLNTRAAHPDEAPAAAAAAPPDAAARGPAAAAPTGLSETDMAQLLSAFNDATARLHVAHESLRAEVARLKDELRHANEQLERSRRLAALGEMAAGIAHEIRNPLGSIRLYARMLEEDLKDRESERGVAQRIGAAVRTVDAVVQDVLAFAREVKVHPRPVAVDELFSRAIDEALAEVPGSGEAAAGAIQVVRADGRGGPAEVECDPALMQRALVNIVSNAVQAMRERHAGVERILTTGAGLRQAPGSDGVVRSWAVLTVSDTGPGVTPEVMQRMFNPFFTTRATGTGLGLAIVHRIVDAHGGRVTVRNRVENGCTAGAVVEMLIPAPAPEEHKQSMQGDGPAVQDAAGDQDHRRSGRVAARRTKRVRENAP